MGTYDLPDGFTHAGPSVTIPDDVLGFVRETGGYSHPLFNDPAFVRDHTPFDRHPVPGPLVLFLLGGLAERTGLFDDTVVALVGMDEARFVRPAFPGDELTFALEVLSHQPSGSGSHGTVRFRWTALRGEELIADVVAAMLFRLDG